MGEARHPPSTQGRHLAGSQRVGLQRAEPRPPRPPRAPTAPSRKDTPSWLLDLHTGNPRVLRPALHTDPEKPARVCLGPSQLQHGPDPPPGRQDVQGWRWGGGVLPRRPPPCPHSRSWKLWTCPRAEGSPSGCSPPPPQLPLSTPGAWLLGGWKPSMKGPQLSFSEPLSTEQFPGLAAQVTLNLGESCDSAISGVNDLTASPASWAVRC